MPLISPTTQATLTEAQKEKLRKEKVASSAHRLLELPRTSFTQRFNIWKQSMELVWSDPNPQEVLNALGTSAKELFQLSASEAQALLSVVGIGATPDVAAALTQNIV